MRLCLAAWEGKGKYDLLLKYKCRFWLSSYLYIVKMKPAVMTQVIGAKEFFLLDSGAHTFQKEGNSTDYDRFVREYAQYVKNNPWIDEYVELDIEAKVGMPQVEKWRQEMTEIVGKPPIVVWHRERGKQYYKHMVRNYPYVGFSGFVTKSGEMEVPIKYIGWFIKEAHDNNCQIHGFGFTRSNLLYKFPFDSVDSSSWIMGSKFGTYFHLRNGIELRRDRYGKLENLGFKNSTRDEQSAATWCKFQTILHELWSGTQSSGSQTPA